MRTIRPLGNLCNNALIMQRGGPDRTGDPRVPFFPPPGRSFGNWMLTSLVQNIFGGRTKDMLSGSRVFSRRFVKSFPALSRGFKIETELTVHALELRMPIADVDTVNVDRPPPVPRASSERSRMESGPCYSSSAWCRKKGR